MERLEVQTAVLASMKRIVRYGLSWGVTLGLALWVLHRVPWKDVWMHAGQVRLAPLLAACLLSLVGNLLVACEKYRMILLALGARLSFRDVVVLKVGSIPLKGLLPLKAGEAVRVVYLQRRHDLSYLRGGASVLLNFGFGLLAVGILMIPGYVSQRGDFLGWLLGGILVGLGALLMMRVHPRSGSTSSWGGRGWLVGPARAWDALAAQGRGFVIRMVLVSTAFEGIKVLNYALVFHATGIHVTWESLFQVVPFLILATSLPVGVMGIGVREGGILLAFGGLASNGRLVGSGLWVSVVESMVPLVAGLFLLRPFFQRLVNGSPLMEGEKGW